MLAMHDLHLMERKVVTVRLAASQTQALSPDKVQIMLGVASMWWLCFVLLLYRNVQEFPCAPSPPVRGGASASPPPAGETDARVLAGSSGACGGAALRPRAPTPH